MTFEKFKKHVMTRYEKELKDKGFAINIAYAPTTDQQRAMFAMMDVDPESDWAKAYCDKLASGVTTTPELDDVDQDIVEVFYNGMKYLSQTGFLGTTSMEEVVDEVLSHEFRHALQVIELRKYGLLEKAYELEKAFTYGHGPMEFDAILAQKGRAVDISVFIGIIQDLLA